MNKGNLFEGIDSLTLDKEFVEKIFQHQDNYVERIVSKTHATPDGVWLDQELNEWVILLKGEAKLKFDESGDMKLSKGDYVFIPAHCKHRVEWTSDEPECIWLAFFFR